MYESGIVVVVSEFLGPIFYSIVFGTPLSPSFLSAVPIAYISQKERPTNLHDLVQMTCLGKRTRSWVKSPHLAFKHS